LCLTLLFSSFAFQFKLCKVTKAYVGTRGVPVIVTHDARTIRYPDPHIKANDTVRVDIESGKATEYFKFETGKVAMITGGRNLGRVGVIQHRGMLCFLAVIFFLKQFVVVLCVVCDLVID
jgi:ribosomal protein S4E